MSRICSVICLVAKPFKVTICTGFMCLCQWQAYIFPCSASLRWQHLVFYRLSPSPQLSHQCQCTVRSRLGISVVCTHVSFRIPILGDSRVTLVQHALLHLITLADGKAKGFKAGGRDGEIGARWTSWGAEGDRRPLSECHESPKGWYFLYILSLCRLDKLVLIQGPKKGMWLYPWWAPRDLISQQEKAGFHRICMPGRVITVCRRPVCPSPHLTWNSLCVHWHRTKPFYD